MSAFTTLLLLPALGTMALASSSPAPWNRLRTGHTAPAVALQQASADTVTLQGMGAGTVSGRAIVTHSKMGASVSLTLTGLKSGTRYAAQVDAGACSGGGAMQVSLNGVTAGPGGQGRSMTSLPASAWQGNGVHSIQILSAGSMVACGEVEPQGSGM